MGKATGFMEIDRVERDYEPVEDRIKHFKEFLGTNFDEICVTIESSLQRKELLEFLIKYMQIHLEDFRRPQSLNIMYDLFKKR